MNLLIEPTFRIETKFNREKVSLPALLAAYGDDRVKRLTGIQRHQQDAFHVFLSYLAGAVLVRQKADEPVQSEEFWRRGLLDLSGTAGNHAWTMVVDDLSLPAFMQPPLPEDTRFTSTVATPDELDVLQTAKNHDVKRARAASPTVDSWVYSLISLQTMSGFSGRGNQGISRMNSGFGNRAIVELTRSRSQGQRWMDAVRRLLRHRQKTLAEPFGYDADGLVLVWLHPWDGRTPLELRDLDPFYLEICRRVRLVGSVGEIKGARLSAANQPRIAAKHLAGVVGDPWLPVDRREMRRGGKVELKALTFPPSGITADHMRRLIFADELQLSALQKPLPDWGGSIYLNASVLVRGQGVTDGFYEWEVMIPAEKAPSIFASVTEQNPLEELSRDAIVQAGLMQNRVLKPALFAHILGAPARLRLDDDFAGGSWPTWARRFEDLWSQQYFPWLWSIPEPLSRDEAIREWVEQLHEYALQVLLEAEESLPAHSGRKYQIQVRVRNIFWGAYYNNFAFMRGEKGFERSANRI